MGKRIRNKIKMRKSLLLLLLLSVTNSFSQDVYKTLVEDIKFNYEEVSQMNFHVNDSSNDDQKIIFYIKWNDDINEDLRTNSLKKIREWIALKLDSDIFEIQKVE